MVHSTSFSPTTRKPRPPHTRQATRSASLAPRLRAVLVTACGVSLTARRRPTTSVGDSEPDLRLTCRPGERRTSAKFQRTRKSTMRINVLSSAPETALSSFAESHRSSDRADHTPSRNTLLTVSFRTHASPHRQRKSRVTRLCEAKSHRKLSRKFLETPQMQGVALSSRKVSTRCSNPSRGWLCNDIFKHAQLKTGCSKSDEC